MILFPNRLEAGEALSAKILEKKWENPIILGVPRGGVPVGYPTAKKLKCPLDVVLVRKIPVPWSPEAGYGAIALDGTVVLNEFLLSRLKLSEKDIQSGTKKVLEEVIRREKVYRQGKWPLDLKGKTVFITDDGLASGYTTLAAVKWVVKQLPFKVIVASPVASDSAMEVLKPHADELIVLHISYAYSFAVACFYKDFSDMTDEELLKILEESELDFRSKDHGK